MSISGITPTSGYSFDPTAFQNVRNRVQQDFTQISQSLQSNDLAGAQKAYSDLVQLSPGAQTSKSNTNPVQSDFATLGQALQSGDLNGAQTAFSKLQTDLSTAAQGTPHAAHGRHHHHAPDADAATTASTGSTDNTASTATTGSTSILGTLLKTGLSLLG